MPKSRQPREVWEDTRRTVWLRDGQRCVRVCCQKPLKLEECHIDHIKSGKLGSNHINNLRTLCRRCHTLRADHRHSGMIANALALGIIPWNWRELVWDD